MSSLDFRLLPAVASGSPEYIERASDSKPSGTVSDKIWMSCFSSRRNSGHDVEDGTLLGCSTVSEVLVLDLKKVDWIIGRGAETVDGMKIGFGLVKLSNND